MPTREEVIARKENHHSADFSTGLKERPCSNHTPTKDIVEEISSRLAPPLAIPPSNGSRHAAQVAAIEHDPPPVPPLEALALGYPIAVTPVAVENLARNTTGKRQVDCAPSAQVPRGGSLVRLALIQAALKEADGPKSAEDKEKLPSTAAASSSSPTHSLSSTSNQATPALSNSVPLYHLSKLAGRHEVHGFVCDSCGAYNLVKK